jgi:hypothetical protein
VFDLPVDYEDDHSAVFKCRGILIHLLKINAVREFLEPAQVAGRQAGSRLVLALHGEDVDALWIELSARGVELLNTSFDRSWKIRTASFMVPAGSIWGIAKYNRYDLTKAVFSRYRSAVTVELGGHVNLNHLRTRNEYAPSSRFQC